MNGTVKDLGFIGAGKTRLPLHDFQVTYALPSPETCPHPTIVEERGLTVTEWVYACSTCHKKIAIPAVTLLHLTEENLFGILALAFGEERAQQLARYKP